MAKKEKGNSRKSRDDKGRNPGRSGAGGGSRGRNGKRSEGRSSGGSRKSGCREDEYLNALIRERADFENYKKRNAAAVSQALRMGRWKPPC